MKQGNRDLPVQGEESMSQQLESCPQDEAPVDEAGSRCQRKDTYPVGEMWTDRAGRRKKQLKRWTLEFGINSMGDRNK